MIKLVETVLAPLPATSDLQCLSFVLSAAADT